MTAVAGYSRWLRASAFIYLGVCYLISLHCLSVTLRATSLYARVFHIAVLHLILGYLTLQTSHTLHRHHGALFPNEVEGQESQ
jgi:hypothetical protein